VPCAFACVLLLLLLLMIMMMMIMLIMMIVCIEKCVCVTEEPLPTLSVVLLSSS